MGKQVGLYTDAQQHQQLPTSSSYRTADYSDSGRLTTPSKTKGWVRRGWAGGGPVRHAAGSIESVSIDVACRSTPALARVVSLPLGQGDPSSQLCSARTVCRCCRRRPARRGRTLTATLVAGLLVGCLLVGGYLALGGAAFR